VRLDSILAPASLSFYRLRRRRITLHIYRVRSLTLFSGPLNDYQWHYIPRLFKLLH